MNSRLATQAVAAVTDRRFTAAPHMCQAFAREVVQAVYGDEYNDYHGPNARISGLRWRRGGFAVTGPIEVGDLLYKTPGKWGHVGIYVGEDRVAENSTTRYGRVQGYKGFRTLGQYDSWQITVRIPGDAEEPDGVKQFELVLHDRVIARMPLHDGHAHVQAIELCERLGIGHEVDWDNINKHVVIGGRELDCDVWQPDGHAWVPIRLMAAHVGLAIKEPDDQRRVVLYRP